MSASFFISKGLMSAGFLNFSAREAYLEANSNAFILDVRESNLIGYKKFAVKNIFYIPLSELKSRIDEIPVDKGIIVADSVGLRSKEAILILNNLGFTNIANLAGGLVDWERDGVPLIINNLERLDGSCACQLKPRYKQKNK